MSGMKWDIIFSLGWFSVTSKRWISSWQDWWSTTGRICQGCAWLWYLKGCVGLSILVYTGLQCCGAVPWGAVPWGKTVIWRKRGSGYGDMPLPPAAELRIPAWLRLEGASGGHLPPPPPLYPGSSRAGCPGLRPHNDFWTSPRMETPQCQCSVTITVKKCHLMFRQNLLCFNLCRLPLVVSLDTSERAWLCLLYAPPFRYLYKLIRSPMSFLFSRLNSPCSLSLSLCESSSSLLILVALRWTLSSSSVSRRAGHSGPGVASPALSGGEGSPLFQKAAPAVCVVYVVLQAACSKWEQNSFPQNQSSEFVELVADIN